MLARLLPLLALWLLPFLAHAAPAAPSSRLDPALVRHGRDVVVKAQCNRCHEITGGLAAFKREMHCVNCHNWILGTKGKADEIAKQRVEFPDWDRYLDSVVHFTRLPDLGTLTRRVRPSAVRRTLDAPRDLRPHLEESMIPLRLSAADKDAVVAWLASLSGAQVAPEEPAPAPETVSPDRIAAGRGVFVAKGCPTCHVFGNVRFQPGFDATFYKAMGANAQLAPNLRFARERVPRSVFVRFVQDPQSVDPRVTMPKLGVTPAEAEHLADFVYAADPELGTATASLEAPVVTALDRKVTFDEVYDELLGKICVHCHMDPATNSGDGGAGNTGGLGFAGKRLSLESYPSVARGLLRDGKRVSILKPGPAGQPPLLLEALLRRHREASRDQRAVFADHGGEGLAVDPAAPGMPLGLPALSVAQLRLVKTWLDQGAPGPAE
jgi:hypothetical protein